jgi:ribosomal-protein-alanine N-acetyltransferase
VRRLAGECFAALGDYRPVLPDWLRHPGVTTHIAEEEGVRVGFTMLGFYGDEQAGAYVADLLAIAVAPEAEGRGIGGQLLTHAIAEARAARRYLPLTELRLTVAEDNQRARRLFARFDFTEVPGDHGRYDGGQRALVLARPLVLPPTSRSRT